VGLFAAAEDFTVNLSRWGWNALFEAIWKSVDRGKAVPARVISQQKKFWALAGEFGECWGEASGKLRLATEEEGADWPAVGDWVAAEVQEPRGRAMIQEVLTRKSKFVRKATGKSVREQILAANADTVFLVSALDGDFNLRRIERYLAQSWESGAKPVVVLNKADACADANAKAQEVERLAAGTIVHVLSAKTGEGCAKIEKYLNSGETLVLLGSSGVGKSTIVNRLMGRAIQEVQDVRESDSRGRHATTARELFALPGGALLIDTPGLRGLQLWDADEGIAQTFSDIELLAARCRFGNCRHEGEPGCAVRLGVEDGNLDEGRLENCRKVLREQAFLRRKVHPEARLEQKEHWKKIRRAARQKYEQREKDGGKR
jgi:ribosome biogenesis GTPase / thiamine phosphate phosphatase